MGILCMYKLISYSMWKINMPYTVGTYVNITLDIGQNISYYTCVWENMKIKTNSHHNTNKNYNSISMLK